MSLYLGMNESFGGHWSPWKRRPETKAVIPEEEEKKEKEKNKTKQKLVVLVQKLTLDRKGKEYSV